MYQKQKIRSNVICTPVKKAPEAPTFRHVWWARNVIKSYKQYKQTFIWYGWHGRSEEEQTKNIWDSLKLNFLSFFICSYFIFISHTYRKCVYRIKTFISFFPMLFAFFMERRIKRCYEDVFVKLSWVFLSLAQNWFFH